MTHHRPFLTQTLTLAVLCACSASQQGSAKSTTTPNTEALYLVGHEQWSDCADTDDGASITCTVPGGHQYPSLQCEDSANGARCILPKTPCGDSLLADVQNPPENAPLCLVERNGPGATVDVLHMVANTWALVRALSAPQVTHDLLSRFVNLDELRANTSSDEPSPGGIMALRAKVIGFYYGESGKPSDLMDTHVNANALFQSLPTDGNPDLSVVPEALRYAALLDSGWPQDNETEDNETKNHANENHTKEEKKSPSILSVRSHLGPGSTFTVVSGEHTFTDALPSDMVHAALVHAASVFPSVSDDNAANFTFASYESTSNVNHCVAGAKEAQRQCNQNLNNANLLTPFNCAASYAWFFGGCHIGQLIQNSATFEAVAQAASALGKSLSEKKYNSYRGSVRPCDLGEEYCDDHASGSGSDHCSKGKSVCLNQ